MKLHSRLFLSTSVLAVAVALGCQAPPQMVAAQPRVVVRESAMQLAPVAPMSIVLDSGCPDRPAGYGLAQAPGGLDPRIDRFDISISGPALIKALEIPVSRADFNGGCQWLSEVYDLPPGTYLVTLNAYNAIGDVIAHAKGHESVDPTKPKTITFRCDFSTGRIVVCVGPCGSPSPTPSPSPISTFPPPGPLPPIAGLFDRIHGLHADDQGNVYLFGLKPKPWPDDYHIGRTVEVTPSGATRVLERTRNPAHDYVVYEGDLSVATRGPATLQAFAGVVPKRLTYGTASYSANTTYMKLGDGMQIVGYASHTIKADFLRPWGASAGLIGQIIAPGSVDPANAAGYMIAGAHGTMYVDRRALQGDRRAAVERPISLTLDRVSIMGPIWTCKKGILTRGSNHLAPPRVLVSRPAYGLAQIVPLRSEVFFTTYEEGDTNIYYDDLATGAAPSIAYTFLAGTPHRIEKGADGAYYVLLAEGPLAFDAASGDPYMYEFPGKREVRVVKLRFDAAAKKLVDPKLIVDTFQNPAPSW